MMIPNISDPNISDKEKSQEVGCMKKLPAFMLSLFSILFLWTTGAVCGEIVVYSARNEHLLRPLLGAYRQATGITIKYTTGEAAVLLQRLKAEGKNTPADMLITVDAGNLWHAAQQGILQGIQSEALQKNIPEHLRDPENKWFGLSVRARTIVHSTDRVKVQDLSTYEDLAGGQWKGRLLLRTSKKVYNQSLVAMLIAEYGQKKAEQIIQGWVDNLGAPPFSNDTQVMKAILAGQGDVGLVNTYYFGRLLKKDPGIPLALFWPNQDSGGVHVNVSGAGITTHAKHKPEAVAFLEWMSSEQAQHLFADLNLEYPANPNVPWHPQVASWGRFKQNPINVKNAGAFQAQAIQLMDRAGYR